MTNKIIIQIVASEDGSVNVSGNTTDLALINLLLDKLKNQLITARPKEPSLIERV